VIKGLNPIISFLLRRLTVKINRGRGSMNPRREPNVVAREIHPVLARGSGVMERGDSRDAIVDVSREIGGRGSFGKRDGFKERCR
jgi:hypothetical protein